MRLNAVKTVDKDQHKRSLIQLFAVSIQNPQAIVRVDI